MLYLKGQPRDQLVLYTTCLEEMIPPDNSVRLIDAFVDALDLEQLGFAPLPAQGRPPYHPGDLLKLYLYGYMNRMRSSRVLEKECLRNIEVMWLLGNLQPDHNTIARFRKANPKAIRRAFRQSVEIARHFNLIGGLLIAGDSTKLRAQNSKKNNFNKKKIARHLDYIDKKLEEHNAALAQADGDESEQQRLQEEIEHRQRQRQKYEDIDRRLDEDNSSDNPQISTSDPDSRHQIVRGTITEVCYTLQTTVDAKNKILLDYKITNENDKKAMGGMLRRAKSILRQSGFTALYDKGYHTGSELHVADTLGINALVAIPAIGRASQAPDPAYNAEHFTYNEATDTYTCPQGETLRSNGTRYKARNYTFKQYKTNACKHCPVRHRCTTARANGKIIQRTQYASHIEANARRVAAHEALYKKRQALVEHPFGTLKRQWGFDHILTKRGLAAAAADAGLMALAYNLKRLFRLGYLPKNCVDALFNRLKAYMRLYEHIQHAIRPKILFLEYVLFFTPKVHKLTYQ
jgi:transposase